MQFNGLRTLQNDLIFFIRIMEKYSNKRLILQKYIFADHDILKHEHRETGVENDIF